MKNALLTLLAALVLGLTACKEENEKVEPLPSNQPVVGAVRPRGTSLGAALTKQIGPEGGSLQSADGTLTLTVPAGALRVSTQVGIEPITSTCTGSIGHGWRLTPHGKPFAKPVQLTVDYSAHQDSVSVAEALGLVYQDEKGIWQFIGASAIDKTDRRVTMFTDHFSDWALLQWMTLSPITGQVHEKQQVTLEALQYIALPDQEGELLIPLAADYQNGYPVGEPQALPDKYIGQWSLAGPGLLNRLSSRFQAVYLAPESVSSAQVAAVALSLQGFKGQAALVSNLTLLGKEPVIEYLQVAEREGFGGNQSVLTIYGANFGAQDPSKSKITINEGTVEEILLWGDKIIVCTIPLIGPNSSGPVKVTTSGSAVTEPRVLNEWNVVMKLDHPHARFDQSLHLSSTFHLRIRGDATAPPENLNIIGKDSPNTINLLSYVHWQAGGTGSSVLNNEEACGTEVEEWTASQGQVQLTPEGRQTDEQYFKADLYLLPGQGFEVSLQYHAREVIPSHFTFTSCTIPPYTMVDNLPFDAYLPIEFWQDRLPLRLDGSTLKGGASETKRMGIGSRKLHANGADPKYMKDITLVWNDTPARY